MNPGQFANQSVIQEQIDSFSEEKKEESEAPEEEQEDEDENEFMKMLIRTEFEEKIAEF